MSMSRTVGRATDRNHARRPQKRQPVTLLHLLKNDQVGQQYLLLAKTPKSWAGQTRTLTVTLDDKSVHTQVVTF
jgi:hypothetical protein